MQIHRDMPLSKIAVGVDFSPESQRAVDHATMLARRTGAALTLVHVATVPPPLTVRPNDAWAALLRERLAANRARLDELRERLRGQGVDVSQVVADGDPDPALAEAARELGADLVVVGTQGRSGARRLLLGSVAEKTIRLAASSVLVARGEVPASGYRHVVVGTDFSELAWRALERALELTAPGGHVHVVHAWQAPYIEYDLTGRLLEGLREAAEIETEANRERVLAMRRPEGVMVGLDLADGVPFVVLDEYSKDAELLVVGSHGRRGIRRLLLGSVAEATVRHARCSVLVTR
jgi:nucleotide-binding universal stress UspA family protein